MAEKGVYNSGQVQGGAERLDDAEFTGCGMQIF